MRFLMKSFFRVFVLLIVVASAASSAFAVTGTVTGGKIDPLPIAVAPFLASQGSGDQATAVAGIIANDLNRSGYFKPLDPASFIEQISSFDQNPNFGSWRQVKAQALVVGQVSVAGGKLTVAFKLYDVNTQAFLAGSSFTAPANLSRRLAHKVADMIYNKITGFAPYFDTRIVYVDESGPKNLRIKKLAIMDQDGFNAHTLTNGKEILLTPRFSPSSQEITYSAIGAEASRVYIYNIDTGQKEIVGDIAHMSFAPRFSPDGQRIVMSLESDDGRNANIYEMDLRSKQIRQITNVPAINTAPCYSPDGTRIAFESDRGGTQQIYTMNADGSNQQRISFGQGRYSTPVWSPDGKYLAFTKQSSGGFGIGVMNPDGSGERILTEGFHNEGPSWSPNSRVIMFFRDSPGENGGSQLWSVDISGYNEQAMQTANFATDPAWSPLLK
ncbi:Tol-Pal system beta propeller repeat protein TolB [Aestuariivirga litoralis]|uniref:Tol-Pal system beta propeller repeat protein TolB n=1 Tax=Aestuariivirga litoralis TaxID=2650924 RepID=UPI0018C7E5F6